jgi:hypothetical protein
MGKEISSIRAPLPTLETHRHSDVKITRHKEGFYEWEVKGIPDDTGEPIVMDMTVLRNGDVNLSLRDVENKSRERFTINFSGSADGFSMAQNMAQNLRRIPYELFEHQGRLSDAVPAPKVSTRQRSELKIIPSNEITSGEVCGIQGDVGSGTLMDIFVAGEGAVSVSLYRKGVDYSQKLKINFTTTFEGTKAPILSATFHKIAQDIIEG